MKFGLIEGKNEVTYARYDMSEGVQEVRRGGQSSMPSCHRSNETFESGMCDA